MARPTDRICLTLPTPEGAPEIRRWWYIEQPRPSVAFALQVRVAAALGGASEFFLQAFFADPDQQADLEADRQTVGEALALRTLRRARAGQALAGAQEMRECAARLWAVLSVAAGKGDRMDALLLAGEAERERGTDAHRWPRASLLHRLLLDSGLRYDGDGPSPLGPVAATPMLAADTPAHVRARAALRDAVAQGGVGEFVRALDEVLVSPDELALLSAWAVLHLFRPF